MHPNPLDLLALIDTYAAARSRFDESYRERAAWASALDHADMLAARAAVADVLGIPAEALPPIPDETGDHALRDAR